MPSVSAAALDKGAPTSEQGSMLPDAGGVRGAGALGMGGSGVPGWSYFTNIDELEHVEDLKWKPNGKGAVYEYHRMRTDAQCQGLYLGCTLPIRRYDFRINPNGADPAIVQKISSNYNIPILGQEDQPVGRRKRRFTFDDHLRHALLAIIYGHMYFEQVGEVSDEDGFWHLRKLGVRMPQSIQKILLAEDGGLAGIAQRGMGVTSGGRQRILKVNRLLAYVWDREGANWTGRSMFRGIRKNFLLKDTVLRVGAINIERAGGVPVIEAPKGATPNDIAELGKMARAFRVGANAGGAIPNGAALTLARAAGGEEAVNFVKLQNEEMSRGWLMMFMNLGQATTGSYALGSSLLDYVLNTQEVIAQWICDTFNEHMIEDDVDWNWTLPNNASVPLLTFKRTDDREMALKDLALMVDRNVIQVDEELEAFLRETYRLPRRNPELEVRATSGAGSPPPGSPGLPASFKGDGGAGD